MLFTKYYFADSKENEGGDHNLLSFYEVLNCPCVRGFSYDSRDYYNKALQWKEDY